ncbi:MAG: chemotaxis protein CheW [Geobacter sp.]|uniref:chemotaxis protein CheW n=1 Tax=Trichlorobacter sp. TaxID=2911007 RepID=UPI002A36F735|nr:chemotaxis protein CheW [Trichlorobacter sp.]MDY0384438.1 chemotaxis protein CheW [Trichlorobacter sp.]
MDLAKIRTKARQEGAAQAPNEQVDQQPSPQETVVPPALAVPDDSPESADSELVIPGPAPIRSIASPVRFDPLAVILAGRQADQVLADVEPQPQNQAQTVASEDVYQEFLCFLLGDEEYGVNIMEIKELIKPRELTEVPRAPHFVDGIISLRGMIVPVIDLRKRLGLHSQRPTAQQRIVIVRQRSGFSGLRVDSVTGVVRIADHRREAAPAALEGIDREFVAGIGRADNRMVILLDIQNVADLELAAHGN